MQRAQRAARRCERLGPLLGSDAALEHGSGKAPGLRAIAGGDAQRASPRILSPWRRALRPTTGRRDDVPDTEHQERAACLRGRSRHRVCVGGYRWCTILERNVNTGYFRSAET